MSRSVWSRVFALQMSPLSEATEAGKVAPVIAKHFPNLKGTTATPMALRWILHPFHGLARQPFQLWRRRRRVDDLALSGKSLLVAPQNVLTAPKIEWGKARMYDLGVKLTPVANRPITLVARDSHGATLPGQQVTLGVAGWVRLRGPGMASLMVTAGEGTVDAVVGVDEDTMANLADWSLVQVVGLPVKPAEIAAPSYDSATLQGYVPASLSGFDAGKQRVDIAAMLQLACPVIPGVPASPSWPPPDSLKYFTALRDGPVGAGGESLFGAVRGMLAATKDSDPKLRQRDYRLSKQLAGLSQIGQGGPPQGQTTFSIPVAGVAMLHAATDSLSSTGLGYGTVDIVLATTQVPANVLGPPPPTYTRPVDTVEHVHDYMVSCTLHMNTSFPKGAPPMNWDVEIAAIGELRVAPPTPTDLLASLLRTDRPPGVDQPVAETRALQWKPWRHVLAYGLAARRKASEAPKFLNAPRIDGAGYQAYVPAQAAVVEGKPAVDAKCKFVDLYGQQPTTGTATTNYWVIATDVFGRWSNWTTTNYLSTADPVRAPGLDKVDFFPGPTPADAAAPLPGTLVVDFAWDWFDRKPGRLELHGSYFVPNGNPPAGPPAGFAVKHGQASGPAVVVTFDAAGKPQLEAIYSPPAGAVVKTNGAVTGPSADVRRYQLHVPNAAITFGAASQVGYAAWIRGSEAVRPNEMSTYVGPRATYTYDPQPPKISVDPPPILWTELPDVNGKARARLTWTGDSKALGYFVWVATEAPLAKLLGVPTGPDIDIEARAADLKAAVELKAGAGDEDAIRVFSRVNAQALTTTELQIELPAAADTLFFYRVSAVGKTAVESARSSKVFAVAVPRRIVPGQPALQLRAQADGIEVTAVAGVGPDPDGYALLRVREEALARDPGLMGPPKLPPGPQWTPEVVTLVGSARKAQRYLDPRPPSWFPYFYRVRAVGGSKPDDRAHGRLRGESLASNAQEILRLPPGPPKAIVDDFVAVSNNQKANVFTLHTDLPMRRSPVGVARIEVVYQSPGPGGQLVSAVQLAADTHKLAPLAVLPDLVFLANDTVNHGAQLRFYRSPNGVFTPRYLLCLPCYPATETVHDSSKPEDPNATIVRPVVGTPRFVRLTDPLGRITEVALVQQPPPILP